jgi:hypothetical protein
MDARASSDLPRFESALEPFDIPDGFVVPQTPTAPTNGQACTLGRFDECGPRSACAAARIRRRGTRNDRFATPGRCVDSVNPSPFHCVPRQATTSRFSFTKVCMGFFDDQLYRGFYLSPRDCLRLREEALQQAGPDEEVTQCWHSDETIATSPAFPVGVCVLPSQNPTTFCELGCNHCSLRHRNCLFMSESYGVGICVGATNGPLLACRGQNPRLPCPRGEACLSPLRNDRDGIPDRERTGVCMSPERCRSIAAQLPDGYRCDETLVE